MLNSWVDFFFTFGPALLMGLLGAWLLARGRRRFKQSRLQSALRLASDALRNGDCKTAAKHYDTALSRARKYKWLVAEAKIGLSLGVIYDQIGRFEEARENFQSALEILLKLSTKEAEDLAFARMHLALVNAHFGNYDKAVAEIKGLLEDSTHQPRFRSTLFSNLGYVFYKKGSQEEAQAYYRKSLGVNCDDDRGREVVINNLGRSLIEEGKYDEAETLLKEIASSWDSHYGPKHFLTAKVFFNLGKFYANTDRISDAESYLERAYVVQKRNLDRAHPRLKETENLYAKVLEAIGKKAEAAAIRDGVVHE